MQSPLFPVSEGSAFQIMPNVLPAREGGGGEEKVLWGGGGGGTNSFVLVFTPYIIYIYTCI